MGFQVFYLCLLGGNIKYDEHEQEVKVPIICGACRPSVFSGRDVVVEVSTSSRRFCSRTVRNEWAKTQRTLWLAQGQP